MSWRLSSIEGIWAILALNGNGCCLRSARVAHILDLEADYRFFAGQSPYSLKTLFYFGGAAVFAFGFVFGLDASKTPAFRTRVARQYKEFAFKKISEKSIGSFSQESTATYISALSNDLASIENNYLNQIVSLVENCLKFVGAFALMIYYSPLLTVLAVAFTLLPI